jgi:hypothetical protein
MTILVFLPSYNDTVSAYKLALKLLQNNQEIKVVIVDDSDDPQCIKMAERIDHERIEVMQRKRSGKWTAWKLALDLARRYDGLIEVDSDVEIENFDRVITSLKDYDLVTAYQDIILPEAGIWRIIGTVYRRMHEEVKSDRRFNMGGQVTGLSRKAYTALIDYGLFNEPVAADDHVIALAAYVLHLKCTTVDCGLRIRLPSTLKEWIIYRSRHRGAIKWAEQYVGKKTGRPRETREASRSDFNSASAYFLKNLAKSLKLLAPAILLLLAIGSILPIENQTKWSRLKSEKKVEPF